MFDSLSLPAAGLRALQCVRARDNAQARLHARAGLEARSRLDHARAGRLTRTAARERVRAAWVMAEVL